MCQPRTSEGLGLCHLEDQNTSFLLKLGFNLVTNENVLWVKVLRFKYKMNERTLDSIARGNCSTIWGGIAKV